jgi:hypothetical protein
VKALFDKTRKEVARLSAEVSSEPVKKAEAPPPKAEPPPPAPPPPAPVAAKVEPVVEAQPEEPQKTRHLVVPFVAVGVGAVSGALAAYFGATAKSFEGRANNAPFESDAIALGGQATTNALAANICWGIAAGALVLAVVLFLVKY